MLRRSMWWLCCGLFIALTGSSRAGASEIPGPPTVELEAGVLSGLHFGPGENEVAFLGIPYAAPPVGELRWKPPRDARGWTGTRTATEFGASCPQPALPWLPDLGWSEDCLSLNVWTTDLTAGARRPVLFFLHGGSNKAGRSQHNPLGPALSRMGVVVVSANYRLGPLGFLAHPALTAESEHHSSGNYGLLDQLQALRWVRQNISRFGGDPGQVTVMGHSAGAYDACLLMTSPMSAGLFQRAILQSGECQATLTADIRTPLPYSSITGSGESEGERFVNDLRIGDGPGLLTTLRHVPVDRILQTWKQNQVNFDAIVDGWVIPEQPAKTFAEGRQVKIPMIVGSNADEGTVFRRRAATIDEYKKYLAADTGKFADQEFRAYPVASDADVPGRFLQLMNDTFAYGANSMAGAMARAGQKAYQYSFSYADRPHFGAFHGAELQFLSNAFPIDWERRAERDRLGEAMRTYWTQFAKTGNPNTPGLPVWPAYDASTDQVLELDGTIRARPMPHSARLKALDGIMKQVVAEGTASTRR